MRVHAHTGEHRCLKDTLKGDAEDFRWESTSSGVIVDRDISAFIVRSADSIRARPDEARQDARNKLAYRHYPRMTRRCGSHSMRFSVASNLANDATTLP